MRRTVRLEVVAPDGTVMHLSIGPGASTDLERYQRALDALAWVGRDDDQPV